MKKIAFISLFVVAMLSGLYAQKTVEMNYALSDFQGIDASNSYTIRLEKGAQFSVRVIADGHVAERVKISASKGVLYLSLEDEKNLRQIKELTAYIVMPELSSVKLSGACDLISNDDFVTDQFKATLSGASDMKLNVRANKADIGLSGASDIIMNLEVEDLIFKSSGASDAKLSGKALNASLTCSGSSDIIAPAFQAETATIKASGSSDVRVFVKNELTVTASGSSSVFYSGNPTTSLSSTGSSDVKKMK